MRPPRVLVYLSTLVGLSDAQAKHFWRALEQARWSRPTAWKELLFECERIPAPVQTRLARPYCSPAAVVTVLHDLAQERRLSRLSAQQIEDAVLRNTRADGRWLTAPPAGAPQPAVRVEHIEGYIEQYWR